MMQGTIIVVMVIAQFIYYDILRRIRMYYRTYKL